uniref:Uncharacterized protein n=1 Tax=Pristionchus pacificus TaxID=54126 RepID=A0A2A6BR02_PRIPA|eukprot:PDM68223.1 hypothetical protein PRIPAC_46267 [Pristionchus pacificus]
MAGVFGGAAEKDGRITRHKLTGILEIEIVELEAEIVEETSRRHQRLDRIRDGMKKNENMRIAKQELTRKVRAIAFLGIGCILAHLQIGCMYISRDVQHIDTPAHT